MESLTTFLTLHLLRHYSTLTVPLATPKGGLSPAKLNSALAYIEAMSTDEMKLSELAAITELSTSHFVRAFKQCTGVTPHQYVMHKRIERAKVLLSAQQQSVTEVAVACGFATSSHFAAIFRRIVGVTPREFRRSL